MARKMQVSGWKSRLPARARVGFWGLEGWRTQFELGRGEDRIMDHGCAAWSGPRARDVFGWKDEEPWSYRSSRPESVPTCQLRWCSPKRTENAVRETHLE